MALITVPYFNVIQEGSMSSSAYIHQEDAMKKDTNYQITNDKLPIMGCQEKYKTLVLNVYSGTLVPEFIPEGCSRSDLLENQIIFSH